MPLFAVVSKTRAKHGKKEMVLSAVTQNFVLFFWVVRNKNKNKKNKKKRGASNPLTRVQHPPLTSNAAACYSPAAFRPKYHRRDRA